MTIDIICPLYNAEKYIKDLHKSLEKQQKVTISNIRYILTESQDSTEEYLKNHQLKYRKIKKSEFSHSKTREEEAFASHADIICFITQDIVIESDVWLYELVKPLINKEASASYSRQLTKYNNIEKYTREYNYGENDILKEKSKIKDMGLKTFFFSDASSAILRKTFIELNGYDQKKLPTNEDMYFAYKLIMNGKKIKYCANSVVYHSHQFSLKQLYDRYKLTGIFFRENQTINQYGTTSSGGGLAKYILKRMIEEKRIDLLCRYPFDMAARLIGMKVGERKCKK